MNKSPDPKSDSRQRSRFNPRWWQIAALLLCPTLLAAGLTLARRSHVAPADSAAGTAKFGGRVTAPVLPPPTTRTSLEAQRISESKQNPDGTITPGLILTDRPITRSVRQIMEDQANTPMSTSPWRQLRPENEVERDDLPQNPRAVPGSTWPLPTTKEREAAPGAPQTPGVNFNGATGPTETGAFPPDTMGAVGPSQFVVFLNGRLRTFNKTTGVADGVINADSDVFFASVITPAGAGEVSFTSDPQVRYDRLSGRWFLVIIDVTLNSTTGDISRANRVLIAVSNGSTITAGTVWSFYQFTGDATLFTDYESLGVDANALYIGGDMFTLAGSFSSTKGFVIPKAPLLSGATATVWAYSNLATSIGAGPFAPRGVDNFDATNTGPTATGYFIGVDVLSFSTLVIRRVTNPATLVSPGPTMSANIALATPLTTRNPVKVPHLGNTGGNNGRLDALDDRLYAAHLRNGRLWTAHNVGVNNTGASQTSGNNRNGARWYEIQNLDTTPAVVQSGTLYDNNATNDVNQRNYWIPSIMVSGQGHAVLACSIAGTNERINAFATGRLSGDTLGTMRDGPGGSSLPGYTASSTAYNPAGDPGGGSGRRWGDYSYVSLDPCDDMTMWAIQEYCSGANTYGARVVQLLAPPPATPASALPSTIASGQASVNVTLTGTSVSGSGFYDPGAGFGCRLNATVSGVTVNSVTYNSPTSITLNLSTVGATSGAKDVTVTNPDGQSVTGTGVITITGGAAPQADLAITKTDGLTTAIPGQTITYTITASNSGPDAATGATVADTFPLALSGVNWTCAGTGGGTCPASGSGNINASVNLPAGSSVTFAAMGLIAPNATGMLSNTAMITAPGGVTDPNTSNNSATDEDTLVPQADLAITKTDGVSNVIAGNNVTYTITASNAGLSNASGATVTDNFPGSLTGVSWTCTGAGGGSCPASGSGNINASVNLPPGGSVTFTATGTLSASATGSLSNQATVSVPGGVTDPNTNNNSATDTDTITPQADLAITKNDGVTSVIAGNAVTYTIVASNSGPSNVTGATVTDTFPNSLTNVTWTCTGAGGGSCPGSGSGNLSASVDLPVGGSVTFTVNATVAPNATGSLSNTATVSGPGGVTDLTPGNNSATDNDTINQQVDLSITKTDGITTIVSGSPLTYTIIASNSGPSTATNATVTDTFPNSLTGVTWTCVGANGGSCPLSGSGNISASVTLPPGGSVTFTALATLAASATGSLTNTATVAAPGGVAEPITGNNSATDTDTVTNVCSITTITVSPGSLPNGTVATGYNQTITASGGVAPYNFAISAGTQPTGLTLSSGGTLSGIPTVAGTFNFTVKATDANGCMGTQAYTVSINTLPTISAVTVSRQQGTLVSNSTIANVTDPDQALSTLGVTVNGSASATVNGVTVSGISVNSGGVVTANVIAACGASNASFSLVVTDNTSATNSATLNVTVTANAAPVLTYANQVVASNGSLTINPATGPSDNGTISSIVLQSPGTYTGTIAVNNTTGIVSLGNAAPGGTHTITVRITDNCGTPTDATFTLSVNCQTITLSPGLLPNGTVGVGYNQTITATGGTGPHNFTISAGALPTGVTLSTGGSLSGIPTAAGTFNFTVKATDANGCFNTQAYTVSINTLPTISAVTVSRQQGSAVSNSTIANVTDPDQALNTLGVTVNNGASATVNGVTVSGISVNSGGVVTANVVAACGASNASFSLVVTDSTGATNSATLNVTVTTNTAPVLTYGNQSVAAGGSLTINPATGPSDNGTISSIVLQSQGTYTGTIAVNNTTGVVSISNAKPGGAHTITVRITDSCGTATDATFTLTVNCPTITLSPATLPNGAVGTGYNQTITASGGTGPYSFTVSAGSLPGGLNLASGGALTGTPNATGTSNFTVQATDANGCLGTLAYSLTIAAANTTPTISAVAVSRQQGSAVSNSTIANVTDPDQALNSLSVTVNSGASATVNGVTVSGLNVDASGVVTANVVASCSATNASFTLTVTDASSATNNATLNVTVTANAAPVLTYGNQSVAAGGSLTINPATGPSDNGTISSIVLQSQGTYTGTIAVNNTTGVVSISDAAPSGTHTITVRISDNCGTQTNATFTVSVNCATITVNPASLPEGRRFFAYPAMNFTASGGTGPYTFAVTAGSLPAGLTLLNGVLSGTPTQAGLSNFTVTATDAAGCTGAQGYGLTIKGGFVKADFDGDGRTDLSVWRGSTGNWLSLNSSNGVLQSLLWGAGFAPYFDEIVPGDYDGDGITDYAIWRGADTFWYIRRSSDGQPILKFFGANYAPYNDIPVPGDYDKDGKTDIAVWRPTTGVFFVLKSSDDTPYFEAWGLPGDTPVPGDYDGDGQTDLAVWRPSNGTWYIKNSSGGTQTIPWGAGYAPYFDVPVQADYDGDGITDLAIWRGADTIWYIRKSSDGQPILQFWGANYAPYNDVPTPGDFDGDGKADIAVWRPTDQKWYVLRSSDGTNLIQQHGQNGDTPVPRR